jgi:predicted phage baseplate assembly protein
MTFPGTDIGTLAVGRSIVVADGGNAHLATVVGVDAPGHVLEFQPPLPSSFQAAATIVYGNVVEARHGERHTDEALGDGDPTAVSQELKLRRSPLAWHLDGTSPQGASPDVEVRVDDLTWSWVSRRVIEDSHEPRYAIAARDDDSYVQIGSLAGGVAASRGKRNVVGDYRVGGGVEGNVAAGSLSTPLDRPPGLRHVANPLPAQGGSDRESAEHARAAAPAALRASGRIVALPDFEYAALDFPGVAKAYATWTWGNLTQLLHLTVAGEGGAELTAATLDELHRFLDRQRDDRRPLRIDNYVAVPVSIRLEVTADERVRPDAVAGEVIAVIEEGFGFERIQFGQAVDASTMTERLHRIDAVLGVRWLELSRVAPGLRGVRFRRALPKLSRSRLIRRVAQDPMPRVPIRGAVAAGSHQVRPAELAIIDVTRRDVVVKSAPQPERVT